MGEAEDGGVRAGDGQGVLGRDQDCLLSGMEGASQEQECVGKGSFGSGERSKDKKVHIKLLMALL